MKTRGWGWGAEAVIWMEGPQKLTSVFFLQSRKLCRIRA